MELDTTTTTTTPTTPLPTTTTPTTPSSPTTTQIHPHLPNIDLKILYESSHTLHIDNLNSLPPKYYSPTFNIIDDWRLLIFPNGNNSDHMSVYLDNTSVASGTKVTCAQFAIVMEGGASASGGDDNSANIIHSQSAQHRFSKAETDWGFTHYYRSPPSSFTLTIHVRIIHDETGTLWHNFNNWNSKQETGYVGLRNQGATCYMNSLLQSLYHTGSFRKAVFSIPHSEGGLVSSLQRVFYLLAHSDEAVDTRELTRSFGWDSVDAFMQHDVQEFNRVLQDTLETKMKKTPAEGEIERLFVGKMKSYIKCINVEYESSRVEDYYDIQLNVKNIKTIEASFEDYIQTEILDGDNKYMSDEYGLQDAKKGVIFVSYPPVLHLQLKRFEYDFERDQMVKINDRIEYQLELELSRYKQEGKKRELYHLHGVLVHSGDLNGGHYVVYIRPTAENKWFKFDDDRVTPATLKQVLDDNYGSSSGDIAANRATMTKRELIRRYTNAYMLVYIRDEERERILSEGTNYPVEIKAQLDREIEEERQRRREEEERHLYCRVRILTIPSDYDGYDLYNHSSLTTSNTTLVRRSDTLSQVMNQLNLSGNIYNLYKRQNHTIRVEGVIPTTLTIDEIQRKYYKNNNDLIVLFNDTKIIDGMIIFIKKYDNNKLSIIDYLSVNNDTLISDIYDRYGCRCLYEEVKPGMVEMIKRKRVSVKDCELISGDILCVSNDAEGGGGGVVEYYQELMYRVEIRVVDAMTKEETILVMSRKDSLDVLLDRIVSVVNGTSGECDKNKIQLYSKDGRVLKRGGTTSTTTSLNEFIQINNNITTIYYKQLEIGIDEMDDYVTLKVVYIDDIGREKSAEEKSVRKGEVISSVFGDNRRVFRVINGETVLVDGGSVVGDERNEDEDVIYYVEGEKYLYYPPPPSGVERHRMYTVYGRWFLPFKVVIAENASGEEIRRLIQLKVKSDRVKVGVDGDRISVGVEREKERSIRIQS